MTQDGILQFFNSFIEVYFASHRIHPFQIFKSMTFSNFNEWCNYHHKSVLGYFHPPIRYLMLIYSLVSFYLQSAF